MEKVKQQIVEVAVGAAREKKNFKIGAGEPLTIIAGPCQIESYDHCQMIAEQVQAITSTLGFNFIFKSSFDKANRTSVETKRGLGMEGGLSILSKIRERLQVPVLTDIHSETQVSAVAEAVDVMQIPAFLCRQTDLLQACGKTGKVIHVKKGQFLHPDDMQFVAEKISATGNKNILLCERGTCFGYRDLVVDMRGLVIMRESGYPVIFDATHSVQSMGGAGGKSGGTREYVPVLARAAVAVGVDGVFIEVHENPDRAPSDGPSMLRLQDLEGVLKQLKRIREVIQ